MPGPAVLTKTDIETLFDGAAESYDRVGPPVFARWAQRLVNMMSLCRGMRVLDVATGTGAVLLRAANAVGQEGTVTGIDLSKGILEVAAKATKEGGIENAHLYRMDAEHLAFEDSTFDAVTCAFALFMLPDVKAALGEMRRVCKPGGSIAVTYFMNQPSPFSPGWPIFAKLCTQYGIGYRMPQRIGLSPGEFEKLLNGCGLKASRIESEVNELVYPGAEDWWGFMLTLGSRATILSMDEGTRKRFKSDYFRALAGVLEDDGYHMSTGVIYALAGNIPKWS
jgi:O-methyltransferase/aklanonic acid methyltransferase